ncbi:MAG TPA: glucokinase [Vicinamibacterales bacterium]|nr:glucokinase [Vicinamibacterales bacterium]
MILAGDVGGTKTLLGLFERAQPRPSQRHLFKYATTDSSTFGDQLDTFARDVGRMPRLDAIAIGIAGPVMGRVARLTNHTWMVDADKIAERMGAPVVLLNDLEAMAHSLEVLTPEEQVVLQAGEPQPDGHAALVAAGTGLGEAALHRIDGRLVPAPSESGHADFAARSDREWELARMLTRLYGRATVEHVLSGPGIVNLHRFTHDGGGCTAVDGVAQSDQPAAITTAALDGRCARCAEALGMFVSAYGAEAGNLALRTMATAGLYVGGGIVRHILPAIQRDDSFMRAFRSKAPMEALQLRIPVKLILNAETGILGAAVRAQSLACG